MKPLFVVRLLAFAAAFAGAGCLLGALAQTWDTFNPSYWTHYVQQQLAGPLVAIGLSTLALLFARPLARWLSRD